MIPLQLSLRNFLSYSEASLDFIGLHTACICGANGAGKSSLLEAITWCVWGKCRAVTEDDAIGYGASDVRVDFTFQLHGETCRIIRTRQRGSSGSLEFQIQTSDGQFRTLTQKGVKATQASIDDYLRIDYDTFINSAYLRQGKADEFMLKKPIERKQILADLLKLDRYECLAERAKEVVKDYKIKIEAIDYNLSSYTAQLERQESLAGEQKEVTQVIARLQDLQATDERELETYKTTARQRETWQNQLEWERKREGELALEIDRLQQDLTRTKVELDRWQGLIDRAAEITTAEGEYRALQELADRLEKQSHADRQVRDEYREVERQLAHASQQLELDRTGTQAELTTIIDRQQEIATILQEAEKITTAIETLNSHRQKLSELEEIQKQVSPLNQRRLNIATQIEREQAKIQARLAEIKITIERERQQLAQRDRLEGELTELTNQIAEIDKRKVYLDRVKEKGINQKSALQKIELDRANSHQQIATIARKLELLDVPDAACPLCDAPLDDKHRDRIINEAATERDRLEMQISLSKQLEAETNREIESLRLEFTEVKNSLKDENNLRDRRGELQAKIANLDETNSRIEELNGEIDRLESTLTDRAYANQLQTELDEIDRHLIALGYDEQTHALVRGDVEKYRWAEIKYSKLKDAQAKQKNLDLRHQELTEKLTQVEHSISTLNTDSPYQQQLLKISTTITEINYDRHHHQQVSIDLRQSQNSQIQYQELLRAQTEHPATQQRITDLSNDRTERSDNRQLALTEIDRIAAEIAKIPDTSERIQTIEFQLSQRRQELDRHLSNLGRIEQQLTQLEKVSAEITSQQEQKLAFKDQQRIYDELVKAFGKNGIQALIIENILPQLEAEANRILARLSNNQFHIQFITQKATKSSTKSKRASLKNIKYIDTLDIIIGDNNGTRPYETYSGGEAFRIDFSIRLALAKLLAQRAGTPLQMLIVDEGFGTQDPEGCERLIAAIQAIAPDFACILTVTHMPQFREAFQTRIEVKKTIEGSQIQVVT